MSFFFFSFSFGYTADIISTVEFNHSGELLATGDKGGRVVIFQQEQEVSVKSLISKFQFALGTGAYAEKYHQRLLAIF